MSNESDKLPVLLRIPFSTYCRKAEIGLGQLAVPYRVQDTLPAGMRRIADANPWEKTVPVLRDGDTVVAGSHRILAWAENQPRDPDSPHVETLFPSVCRPDVLRTERWADEELGPLLRRESYRQLIIGIRPFARNLKELIFLALIKPQFKIPYRFYKLHQHEEHDKVAFPNAMDRTAELLRQAEARDHTYLFGHEATAADCAIVGFWEPLLAPAKRAGYTEHDGWDLIERHVKATRRTARMRRGRERIDAAGWADWKRLTEGRDNWHSPYESSHE